MQTPPSAYRSASVSARATASFTHKLVVVAGLGIALGTGCAAEPAAVLGDAFRPQTAPAALGVGAPASAAALRSDALTTPGLRVVVSSRARTLATIDGRIVRVGDMVNGMRVIQISPQGVVLRGEGGTRQDVKLNPTVIKRPANSTQVQTPPNTPTPTQTQSRTGARP